MYVFASFPISLEYNFLSITAYTASEPGKTTVVVTSIDSHILKAFIMDICDYIIIPQHPAMNGQC